MRRSVLVLFLILAGCVARQPAPEVAQPAPVAQPAARGELIGLTASELVGHFGSPALQIHEGTSLKLQFRGRSCVLDTYLYPQNGVLRVTHVDARTPLGYDTDQAACIFALENPS